MIEHVESQASAKETLVPEVCRRGERGCLRYALALVMGIILIPNPGSTSKLIMLPVVRSALRTLLTSSIFTRRSPTCSIPSFR